MSEEFMNYMNNHLVIGGAEVGTNSAEEEVENKTEELEPLPQEINIELPTEEDVEDDEPQEIVTEKVVSPSSFNCLVVMPTGSADVVLAEMQKRAKEDETIANGLADKSKSIKGCVDYICSQMRQFASKGNSSLMVSDEQVFGLAVHYYTETNEMLGISKSTPKEVKPKADTKPKAEKDDKVKPLNPKPTTPKKKEKKEETLELSLF